MLRKAWNTFRRYSDDSTVPNLINFKKARADFAESEKV